MAKKEYADCLVFNQQHQLLILKRSNTDDWAPGKWCLPGGKIEEGEDPTFAARRELLEETGIDAHSLIPCCVIETDDCTMFWYKCYDYSQELFYLNADEHIGYKWITLNENEIDSNDLLMDLGENLKKYFTTSYVPVTSPSPKTRQSLKDKFNKGLVTLLEYLNLSKAVQAGSISGTETHDKPSTQEALKKESMEKAKKTYVKMDKKSLIDEHKKLIDVLESDSHEDDKKEAEEQKKELETYVKKSFNEGELSLDEYLDIFKSAKKKILDSKELV